MTLKRDWDMNHNGHDSRHSTKTPSRLPSPPHTQATTAALVSSKHRVALITRLALIVLAAALSGGIALCAVNLHAIGAYNQATQSLNANLRAAASPEADLGTLKTRQQQTDAQFVDAQTFAPLLLPAAKTPIQANAKISQTLSARIAKALDQQNKQDDGTANNSAANPAGAGTPSPTPSSALNDEQRNKVEDMLKANQSKPSDAAQGGSTTTHESDAGQGSGTDAGAKPW